MASFFSASGFPGKVPSGPEGKDVGLFRRAWRAVLVACFSDTLYTPGFGFYRRKFLETGFASCRGLLFREPGAMEPKKNVKKNALESRSCKRKVIISPSGFMVMASLDKETIVWITGASSGIGEALAKAWSAEGARVVLSSRKQNELERVKSACACPEKCHIVLLDLADPDSLDAAAKTVLETFGHVDVLVNNGGISQRSLVSETPMEIDRKIMQVDYFGGVQLAKAVLPSMIERKKGHFVAISSIVGVFGFPYRSAYSAAKHAMHGFYETLRAENSSHGIKVTVVCPGRILTQVSLHALRADGKEYGIMDHAQKNGISAEDCARRIMKAVRKGKKETYVCRKDVLMVYFRRYIPALYYSLVGKVKPN